MSQHATVYKKVTVSRGKVKVRGVFRSEEKAASVVAQHGDNSLFEAVFGVDAVDKDSIKDAMDGVATSIIVTPHDMSRDMSQDAQLSMNMMAAAAEAGVSHTVFVGSWTVHRAQQLPSLSSRFVKPEQYLAELYQNHGMRWTSLRAGFFFNNFLALLSPGIAEGHVRFPDIKVQAMAPYDIGRVAASVVASDALASHHGRYYDVSGPEMLSVATVGLLAQGPINPAQGGRENGKDSKQGGKIYCNTSERTERKAASIPL